MDGRFRSPLTSEYLSLGTGTWEGSIFGLLGNTLQRAKSQKELMLSDLIQKAQTDCWQHLSSNQRLFAFPKALLAINNGTKNPANISHFLVQIDSQKRSFPLFMRCTEGSIPKQGARSIITCVYSRGLTREMRVQSNNSLSPGPRFVSIPGLVSSP